MRFLVGTYPCFSCGTPCRVRRRADIPSARCDACRERARFLWCGQYRAGEARRLHESADDIEGATKRTERYVEAAQVALGSAVMWLRAIDGEKSPATRRKLWKASASWAKWARGVLEQLGSMDEVEEDLGLALRLVPPPPKDAP